MNYTFYVVDETKMPPASARGTALASPAALRTAVEKHGGRWSSVDADVQSFAGTFSTVDELIGSESYLANLAFTGSPGMLLAGYGGSWRMGYFDASLVHHLYGALSGLATEIEAAISEKPEGAEDVYRAFASALEEAGERGFGVAILHG